MCVAEVYSITPNLEFLLCIENLDCHSLVYKDFLQRGLYAHTSSGVTVYLYRVIPYVVKG